MNDRELLELAAKAAGVRKRHGMNKSPEHRAWVHMKQRCTNPKKREYKHYGGRGHQGVRRVDALISGVL